MRDPGVYRDLSKPMGAQNPERLEVVLERFDIVKQDNTVPPFHYGSHYSNAGGIINYLLRIGKSLDKLKLACFIISHKTLFQKQTNLSTYEVSHLVNQPAVAWCTTVAKFDFATFLAIVVSFLFATLRVATNGLYSFQNDYTDYLLMSEPGFGR